MYAPNIGAPKYIKQILVDIAIKEIDSNKIIVGDFNIPFTSVDGSSRQKNNEETLALNDTLDQVNLIDRTFHHKAAESAFFSSAHGACSRIDCMLGHQIGSKFKIEITLVIFSDHSAMRIDINYKKNTVKTQLGG